jgi:hypothetical protein
MLRSETLRYWDFEMAEYILLMHDDAMSNNDAWGPYIQKLQQGGFFEGGSAIGDGVCARKSGEPASVTTHLTGFIRVTADSIDQARSLLTGNPHFEAGGTVEIRELPRTD